MHIIQQNSLRRQPTEHSAEATRTKSVFPRAQSDTHTTQIARAESANTSARAKWGFLTDARFHSAVKIKDTGQNEYFVQDIHSADKMMKERIARKFHLLDSKQKEWIADDLKESQINTRRGLPTGLRKALSSPTRMTRDFHISVAPFVRPRAYATGYVVPSPHAPPLQCKKAPSYRWSFLRLGAG